MPLDNGVYRLRYCPDGKPPDFGGVIAVGREMHAPVLALPEAPAPEGTRDWKVSRVSDNPDLSDDHNQHFITAQALLAGWGRDQDGPKEDVLFTTIPKAWNIEPQRDPRVRVISVPTKEVGAIWAVVVERDHLVTKSFPVVLDAPPIPAWEFELIARE